MSLLPACALNTAGESTHAGALAACDPAMVQFLVGDGFQKTICGCPESAAQVFPSGQGGVTCTIAVGKFVVFHFLDTTLTHQIIPRDGKSFPASPINYPTSPSRAPSYVFQLSSPGTYEYQDAFDSGVNGRIIVQ